MSGSTIGLLLGVLAGLVAGAVNWVFFAKVQENAIKGLDRDAVEAKRSMYGKLRLGVLIVDVVVFGFVGWYVGGQFFG